MVKWDINCVQKWWFFCCCFIFTNKFYSFILWLMMTTWFNLELQFTTIKTKQKILKGQHLSIPGIRFALFRRSSVSLPLNISLISFTAFLSVTIFIWRKNKLQMTYTQTHTHNAIKLALTFNTEKIIICRYECLQI